MFTACERIDLALPPLPSRSRLFSLEPVGLKTAGVESFSGYLARLAEEHGVSLAVLFGWEMAPLMGGGQVRMRAQTSQRGGILASTFRERAHVVNGTGDTAREWVEIAGALTLRNDHVYLTLLPWKGVLAHRGQIKRQRAWCPVCYEDRRARGKEVYEPLLWSLEPVTACPQHRRRLRTACGHCGRELLPLESYHRPGFCSDCGGWLGADPGERPADGEVLSGEELEWQSWVSAALGEMLAAGPLLPCEPPREVISASTAACLRRLIPSGSVRAFCRATGVSEDSVGNWFRGQSRVDMPTLLRVCSKTGVSPLAFLTGKLAVPEGGSRVKCKVYRDSGGTGVRRWRRMVLEEVERALTASLKEDPPPSMIGMSRRLARPASALRYRFPALCAAIVARYAGHVTAELEERREKIRHTLELALEEEGCPSMEAVARRNRWHLSSVVEAFPELCRRLAARHARHVEEGWLRIKGGLEAILKETPPPPLKEVPARLGCCETSLYDRFPGLCRRIADRHEKYRKKEVVRRREQFLGSVRRVALTIHREGLYPSVRLVEARLGYPKSLRSDKAALAVLRKVRQELNLHPRPVR